MNDLYVTNEVKLFAFLLKCPDNINQLCSVFLWTFSNPSDPIFKSHLSQCIQSKEAGKEKILIVIWNHFISKYNKIFIKFSIWLSFIFIQFQINCCVYDIGIIANKFNNGIIENIILISSFGFHIFITAVININSKVRKIVSDFGL